MHKSIKYESSPCLFFGYWSLVWFCFHFNRWVTQKHLQDSEFPAALRANTRRESPSWSTLAFISMIDDTSTETTLEKSPLPPEKWWLFGLFSPDRTPTRGQIHITLQGRMQAQILVQQTAKKKKKTTVSLKSPQNFISDLLMFTEWNRKTNPGKAPSPLLTHISISSWQEGQNNFTTDHAYGDACCRGLTKCPIHRSPPFSSFLIPPIHYVTGVDQRTHTLQQRSFASLCMQKIT